MGFSQLLIGATITDIQLREEDAWLWPVLTLQTQNGESIQIYIQSDWEGNAPGTLALG